MNTNRKIAHARGAAIAVAALLASVNAAYAAGQTHVMPAGYGQTQPSYEFKIVSAPSGAAAFAVQLVDAATGRIVTNAHVTMQHAVWMGIKAVPQVQHVLVALETDGQGKYTCSRGPLPAGESATLRAHVPGDSSGTWFTVSMND